MKKATFQLSILSILFVWAMASQLAFSGLAFSELFRSGRSVQMPFVLHDYSTVIEVVHPAYLASGLRPGDRLIGLNGAPFSGYAQLEGLIATAKPGDRATISVDRQQKILTFPLVLQAHTREAIDWPMTIILSVILPLSCLLVGFYIAFARPGDPLAWITMAMLASFTQLVVNGTSTVLPTPWREMLFVYHPLLDYTWPALMVLFAMYFPVPFEFVRHRPWIGWLLMLPFVALSALDIYGNFMKIDHLQELGSLAAFERSEQNPMTLCSTVLVSVFFVLLSTKTRILKSPDLRRRMRLLIVGCSAALTPTIPVIMGHVGLIPMMPPWLLGTCLSALILFPATMAYVIVVQRTMDVRMVVRSGVQYAFASNGIKVLQTGIVAAGWAGILQLTKQANHGLAEVLIIASGVTLIFSIRRLGQRGREWTDRRFFREAYNAELILADLGSSVSGIRDVRVLIETVTKRISESLHVPSIAVFLERNGSFRRAYSLETSASPGDVEFKRDGRVVSLLKRQQGPSKVYFGDAQNWIHGAPEEEQEALRKLDTQLMLPVSLKSRLLGIICLGAKRSEMPYSRRDLQLLNAVASQTGLALENAELTESVRREIAQRERLDRELEIAREVQQRLFPQKLPIVSGLDFAGYCRPAEGVGGDYYDFIHLPDGSLGIAVGDVSGKGIAAALMMASLQASLRGQTIKPCETLSEMIEHINKLVYEASAENRYATFFYAQYEPVSKQLRYVNAGHNPPIVWRRQHSGDKLIRLEDGGTVVGLFPDFPFSEGRVQLEAGDVVVAFTDGISEAMTDGEEEFGEERLIEAFRAEKCWSASDTISTILTGVDEFTAGAKQHDDMTLVVMRVQ